MKEIDFQLVLDKPDNKVFTFTNDDESVYDMSDSTVTCKVYLTSEPLTIGCVTDTTLGTVLVPFTAVHSASLGTFEYIIEQIRDDTTVVPIIKGNITVLDYQPFSITIEAFLESELPANLTLTPNYRNQRIMYWRLILQSAFGVSDANINIESAWPNLVNALLAKLVVYDALLLGARGSFSAFLGGDYTSTDDLGGPIKKIETGPASVEFHSSSQGLGDMFKANAQGESPWDAMQTELCGLANFLEVKLSMCKGNNIIISPRKYQNPDWDFPILDQDGTTQPSSQG